MHPPLWSTLRPVGNSWATRLTILIPLVGYFIIFNAKFSQYIELITEIGGKPQSEFSLSVPPRLFQIYFGLCFIAAGSAIYSLFCPPVIKRHASAGEFVREEGDHLGEYAIGQIGERVRRSEFAQELADFHTRMNNRISQDFSPQEAFAQTKSATLQIFYFWQDLRYSWLRVFAAVCFIIGFVMLVLPAIHIFLKVSSVLFDVIIKHGIWAVF
jgi:hypothetical protein